MNFFEGLSEEARTVLSLLTTPVQVKPVFQLRIDVTHDTPIGLETTQLLLPHQYTSKHNCDLMHKELSDLSDDDIKWLCKDYPSFQIGRIKAKTVRITCTN